MIQQLPKAKPASLEDLRLKAKARLKAIQARNETLYKAHPWPFLRDAVWTVDQVRNSVSKFPGEDEDRDPTCPCGPQGCGSYREHLVNRWFTEQRILVPKSRRMMASWTMLGCHYWLARYQPNSFIAIVSRKRGETDAEGSAELVKRIRFIHEHLPSEITPLKLEYQFARIRLPQVNSEIVGIGQGADQLRQYTCTAIFFDEFAFWEEAQASYAASFPTLEGGGRLAIVSSPNPGYFKQLCHDEN